MAMSDDLRPTRDVHGVPGDEHAHCPAGLAMDLVSHKWTSHIMLTLYRAGGPVRFRELQRRAAPITQKELTKRLRGLERSGLVSRRVYAEVPPRVEYRLTDLGLTLIPALLSLHEWAERYGATVDEHWRGRPAEASDDTE